MSLFAELKRRNVIRVGIAYAIVAWVIAQIAEFAFENFGAPDWVLKSVVVLLLLGLPLALVFAWAFELTPEGLKREKEVDRSRSIVAQTGHKLDRMIIAVLVIALAWFAWDKFYTASGPETESASLLPATPAAVTADKSIAVLPFVAMSSGPDDEYFADGLTEEILNSLAQLPELLVTARTSAFSFKGQDVPVQEIAAALGVQHIVEGSVRRAGDRLRVTAQLIRAADGFHLWSENYDSSSNDTITVQENIAEKIAAALDIVLDEKKREAMREAGLRDVEAFTLYQKGLAIFELAHGEMDQIAGLRQANEYFEKVIARVPDFYPVYLDHSDLFLHALTDAAAGNAISVAESGGVDDVYAAALADYEAAARYAQTPDARAMIEIDYALISDNWRGMRGRIERALQITSCTDANWLNLLVYTFNYSDRSLERHYKLLACDPRRSLSWFNAARAAFRAGNKDEALRLAQEGSEIAPGSWLATELARTLIDRGRYDEAVITIDNRVHELDVALLLKVLIAAHQGDEAAYERANAAFELANTSANYWPAVAAAWGGRRDEANRRAALIDQQLLGSVTLVQIAVWCACGAPFDLEATPNFAADIATAGLPWPPAKVMQLPLKDW